MSDSLPVDCICGKYHTGACPDDERAQGVLRYRDWPVNLNQIDVTDGGVRYRVTLKDVLKTLQRDHRVQLALSPGDATEYRFVLTPIWSGPKQRGLIVCRMNTRGYPSTALVWDWDKWPSQFSIDEAARELKQGNDWSEEVVRWFLEHLFGRYDK